MNKKIAILISMLLVMCFTLSGCKEKNKKEESVTPSNSAASPVVYGDTKEFKLDYLVLVNKQNELPDGWEEKVELVTVKDAYGDDMQVEKVALQKYNELREDLLKNDGVDIELDSSYRSVKEQQEIWDRFTEEYGIDYVKKYVAVPGFSEHHTGLAIDICIIKDGKLIFENDEMIEEKEIFAKVHKKLADYGFILRYLEGKDDITGYAYEPWHLRYINSVDIAKEIMSKGITLEEYLDKK